MSKRRYVHVVLDSLSVLRATAARMDGVELDEVIGAAVWAFAGEDVLTRNLVVEDYWAQQIRASAFRERSPGLLERIRESSARWLSHSLGWLAFGHFVCHARVEKLASPTVCWPQAVDSVLSGVRLRKFSKAQTVMAALDWFAALPEDLRMEHIHRYLLLIVRKGDGRLSHEEI